MKITPEQQAAVKASNDLLREIIAEHREPNSDLCGVTMPCSWCEMALAAIAKTEPMEAE